MVLAHLTDMLTACLKEGVFSVSWKKAILVLIPKGPGSMSGELKT